MVKCLFTGGVERDLVSCKFDVVTNMKLIPRFDEKDVERFFLLFERVADARNWPDGERTFMLQSVFTGKAQEAYSSLSVEDATDYLTVKNAVLRAYELVPEAYRQKFRSWKKMDSQTHVEFVHDISVHFNRWSTASDVKTLDDLKELMLLEQFKSSVSQRVATYISERKPDTAYEAAVMADEFSLIHKTSFGYKKVGENFQKESGYDPSRSYKFLRASPEKQRCVFGEKEKANMCNYCHGFGHWKNECPLLKARDIAKTKSKFSVKPVVLAVTASEVNNVQKNCLQCVSTFSPFVTDGFVRLVNSTEDVPVKILRDTGSSETFVLESILSFSNDSYTGNDVLIRGIGLNVISVPLHKIVLHSDLIQGEVEVAVRSCLPVEGVQVILGNNLAGERVWQNVLPNLVVTPSVSISEMTDENFTCSSNVFPSCVITRSMSKIQSDVKSRTKGMGSETLEIPSILSVSRDDLIKEQKADVTLTELFDRVVPYVTIVNLPSGYYLEEDVLVRKWVPHGEFVIGDPVLQIVVPQSLRQLVLQTAHDASGHLGVKKTYKFLLKRFFWPKLKRDISKSCQTCQLTGKPNQSIKPAPLYPIPAVSQPFEHLIVDCVGPLPRSKMGNEYLLTVMCQVTRYPAVYPLRSLTAKLVIKALTQFISVFGIPRIIQSDQGSNFTSNLFGQVLKQLHIQHNLSSAYHAQSQGALERFHQTLKSLLRSYSVQMGRDWEAGLPWLMMSAREAAQESTGFSPNDLVFGHDVRGPLAVLSADWKKFDPPKNILS